MVDQSQTCSQHDSSEVEEPVLVVASFKNTVITSLASGSMLTARGQTEICQRGHMTSVLASFHWLSITALGQHAITITNNNKCLIYLRL